MKRYRNFIIYILVLFTANTGLSSSKKDLTKTPYINVSISNQNSHEEYHSKNSSDSFDHNPTEINVTNITKSVKPSMSTPTSHQNTSEISFMPNFKNVPTSPKQGMIIASEGGEKVKGSLSSKSNESDKYSNTVATKIPAKIPNVTEKSEPHSKQMTLGTVDQKLIHKRIHGRQGVSETFNPSIPSSISNGSTTTILPPVHKKRKPFFTMITDDKATKESESFIESSTTGRDYVLPIVLVILSLPIVGYLIKIIYRRGTEFTERHQYHRMYLIDGMYNSR